MVSGRAKKASLTPFFKGKVMKKLLVIATLGLAAMGANAQMYGEVTYGSVDIKGEVPGITLKSSPNIFGLTLGYDVHPNFAVEGVAAFNGGTDGIKVNGIAIDAKAKVSSSYGLFVKPKIMASERFELFGRLGVARSKLTLSSGGISESESDTDFAYGLGVNYYFSKNAYGTVNYMKFYDDDGLKANGFNFGIGYKF